MSRLSGFTAEVTNDFASLAAGAEVALDVTVPGARMGDFALCSLGVDVTDLIVTCNVTAANTCTVLLANATAGAIDLASTTVRVKVVPYEVI
jgi:hypothetical protein